MMTKFNYKAILAIILISIALSLVYNVFSSNSIPLIREEISVNFADDTLTAVSHGSDFNSEITLRGISTEKVFELFNADKVIFIDARDQWDFSEGHIPGAINIPEFSFEPNDPQLKELPKDQLYIVYCDGDDCDTSKRLTVELSKIGFTNLYVYIGGFSEWTANGYQIEKENE